LTQGNESAGFPLTPDVREREGGLSDFGDRQVEATSRPPVRVPRGVVVPTAEELREIELQADREHARIGITEMWRSAIVCLIGLVFTGEPRMHPL
jgi:hypothetical protein